MVFEISEAFCLNLLVHSAMDAVPSCETGVMFEDILEGMQDDTLTVLLRDFGMDFNCEYCRHFVCRDILKFNDDNL